METEPDPQRFEDVYPLYEFSVLVKLGLDIASWIRKHFAVRSVNTMRVRAGEDAS